MDEQLLGANIIEHVRIMQKAESALRYYFHAKSKLFRAIVNQISYGKERILIDDNNAIQTYKGTGAAIHYSDITVYGTQYDDKNKPYEYEYFQLKINIEFWKDYEDNYSREFYLRVPIDLEINFTPEKFEQWVATVKQANDEKQKEIDQRVFNELIEKRPEFMDALINRLQTTETR